MARFVSGSGDLLGSEKTLFSPGPGYSAAAGPVSATVGDRLFAVVDKKGTSWDVYGKFLTLSP